MTGRTEDVEGLAPEAVLAILKDKARTFEMEAGSDESTQIIKGRVEASGADSISYVYTQLFPGRLLREVLVTMTLKPKAGGTAVAVGGRHLRTEAPPGTPIDGSADVRHEVTTVWTYLKNLVMQQVSSGRVETVERTYNAGMRELFCMLKDPALLVPSTYVTVENDAARGRIRFQDPTGSLAYQLERTGMEEPRKVSYHVESSTGNMWKRMGDVELTIEKVNEARSKLTARAVPGQTQLSEQMQFSAMYLPAEQLSGYLSFRQDLSMLLGWIDTAVPLQVPHIRDMIVVHGDFVAGGKVEIKDSVLNRTDIRTGGDKDDGKYIVHSVGQMDDKIEIKDTVINRSEIGGRGKNIEVYKSSLNAAFLDGRIDDSEAAMIETLQSSLGITPGEHLAVLDELGVLGKENVVHYARVLSTAMADGKIDTSEEAVLEALRQQYRMPLMVHNALVTRIRAR